MKCENLEHFAIVFATESKYSPKNRLSVIAADVERLRKLKKPGMKAAGKLCVEGNFPENPVWPPFADTKTASESPYSSWPGEIPVCAECGSKDVSLEAFVTWDSKAAKPVAGELCDKGHTCPNCGECSLDWVDPKPEGLDLQHMIEEAEYLAGYIDGEDSPGAREAARYLGVHMGELVAQYQVFRAFVEQVARLQSYNLSGDIPGETVADAMTTINHFQAKANEVLAGHEPPGGW